MLKDVIYTARFKVGNHLFFYGMDDSHVKVPLTTESFFYGNALLDSFNTAGGTNSFSHCMAYLIGNGTSKCNPENSSREFNFKCLRQEN